MKLLFVCLGNICRSPAAEAIMNKLIEEKNLTDQIICDSAGTSQHHAGHQADPRMRKYAKTKGYNITSISRAFETEDFSHFDWIITMDDSNYENVLFRTTKEQDKKKILKMADFCIAKNCDFIPDPYYEGDQGFLNVISLLEDSCSQLLKYLLKTKNK